MAEVTKRTGSRKKLEPQPEAPLLLKDGRTPASDGALTRALHRYDLPVPATTAEKLAAVRTSLEASLKEKLSAHTCAPDCDDPAKTRCPMVVCACTEVSTLETDFCPFCGDLGLPLDGQQLPDSPATQPLPVSALEQVFDPYVVADGEVLPPVPADKAAALDAAVARIERLKGDINKHTWELAAELKRVQDDELYKVRGYENFGAWAVGEVQLSRSLAYELVRVAAHFDKDTYLEVGSTKLRLIAGIEDPEQREAALEDAKAGASKRQLEAAHTSRAVTRDAPAPEPTKKFAPAPEVTSAREVPKKGNEIQLLVKLNGRATTHPFLSAKTSREIKEYAEDAYVELRLADNVVLHMAPKFDRDGKKLVGLTVKAIETVEPS